MRAARFFFDASRSIDRSTRERYVCVRARTHTCPTCTTHGPPHAHMYAHAHVHARIRTCARAACALSHRPSYHSRYEVPRTVYVYCREGSARLRRTCALRLVVVFVIRLGTTSAHARYVTAPAMSTVCICHLAMIAKTTNREGFS